MVPGMYHQACSHKEHSDGGSRAPALPQNHNHAQNAGYTTSEASSRRTNENTNTNANEVVALPYPEEVPSQWPGQAQPATTAHGTHTHESTTVYIIRHACEVGADYDDVHELYATRYGGDPRDDDAVRTAVLADIREVIVETASGRGRGARGRGRRGGGRGRYLRYLEHLKQECRVYSSADKPQIGRTPRQQQRHDALLARDTRISRAEQATDLDISYAHAALAALGRRSTTIRIRSDPAKHALLTEAYADQAMLYRRLNELHDATKEILAKRMREKAAARRMREEGWQGAFLVEEGDSADEGGRAGGLAPWGVDDEIENALKGTGALALGQDVAFCALQSTTFLSRILISTSHAHHYTRKYRHLGHSPRAIPVAGQSITVLSAAMSGASPGTLDPDDRDQAAGEILPLPSQTQTRKVRTETMDLLALAASTAAGSKAPPALLSYDGIVDLDEVDEMTELADNVYEMQRIADGSLADSRRTLTSLYLCEYIRLLRGGEDVETDTQGGFACAQRLLLAVCQIRPSPGVWDDVESEEEQENPDVAIMPWMEKVVAASLPNAVPAEKVREMLVKCKADVGMAVSRLLDELSEDEEEGKGEDTTAANEPDKVGREGEPHLLIFQRTAWLAVSILERLTKTTPDLVKEQYPLTAFMTGLAVHGDRGTGWSTPDTIAACERMHDALKKEFTADALSNMLTTVKKMPVFSKLPASVTGTGRRALRVPKTGKELDVELRNQRAVEYAEGLAILRFAIREMQPSVIERTWHLIVPPVLTALDDGNVLSRAHACDVLSSLLVSVDAEFLIRTGLKPVFEEAVTPCLHFLPPLTPVGQAGRSFAAGVGVLVTLAEAGTRDDIEMYRNLDKIMRDGVLRAVTYAGENARMMEVVVAQAAVVARRLGTRTIRHLEKLIEMCEAPLVSPFMSTYPSLAVAALRTLEEVVRTSWPRMERHNVRVFNAIITCWTRVLADGGDGERKLDGVASANVDGGGQIAIEGGGGDAAVFGPLRAVSTVMPSIRPPANVNSCPSGLPQGARLPMYHRTPRPVPATPSSTLPPDNQLFQQPPPPSSSSVASSSHANHLDDEHSSEPGSPIAFRAPPRRPSTYRPPSPSKHPLHKRTYSSSPTAAVDADDYDNRWLSLSNLLMLFLTTVIVALLFFQTHAAPGVQFTGFDGDPWGDGCPDYKDYSARSHLPLSDGPLELPYQRPVPECRSFRSEAVEKVIRDITSKLVDRDLARLFENCYPSTLDTTVRWHVDGNDKADEDDDEPADDDKFDPGWGEERVKGPQSFIVTGDINAEWLRDSTNQLAGYMPLLKKDEKLKTLVRGAINTQAGYVIESPYCNAFQPPRDSNIRPSNNGQDDAVRPTYDHNTVFECKYEIDSLANFFSLANQYYAHTGDLSFVNDRFMQAVQSVFAVLDKQAMPTFMEDGVPMHPLYTFQRNTNIGTETLALSGRGYPLNDNSSLIRSAFRPSDDACILQYFIPGNAFMSVELIRLAKLLSKAGQREDATTAKRWGESIAEGVKTHGIVDDPVWGKVYAYEVDGYGSRIMMDDANLPSLLSLPKLGWTTVNDPVYQNTRRMILSRKGNPYYLEGRFFKGIGGPHVGLKHAWPMSVLMQAMTSDDDAEILGALESVKKVSLMGLINEGVSVHVRYDYTRSWFAWANSVFAQTVLDLAGRKPHLVFGKGAKPYEI
ncbi:hypothetical protein Dda_6159 [Drechslerella dactyloides]|uniref:Uncharacterized protein n=1 Tax=Drechslerella dactyloides TaxID=74499 RepID=A0AAD6IX87_DREDA|nr:hypothetical protein Dda_6159 [Drechslerella dactyloides]